MKILIKPKAFFFNKKQQVYLLLIAFILWLILASPTLFLGNSLLNGLSETFLNSLNTDLLLMTKNTLVLSLGVILLTSILAIVQNLFYFSASKKIRKIAHLLFLIPLALPAYVLAFVIVGSIGTGSNLENFLYNHYLNLHSLLPKQDSLLLAILSLSLVLSPYMYMNLRHSLAGIPKSVIESSLLLSKNKFDIIYKIVLPYCLPWWRKASVLIFLECIADFGATSIFNIETLSTGIYKHWFAMFSLESAREISFITILFVLISLSVFRFKQIKLWTNTSVLNFNQKFEINTLTRSILFFILSPIVFLGFLFPLFQLINWGIKSSFNDLSIKYIINTLLISFYALIVASLCALVFVYLNRFNKSRISHFLSESIQIGYGIPGTVLAVAVFYPFLILDKYLYDIFDLHFFSGSIVICIMGISFRFLRVLIHPLLSYFEKLPYNLEENASLLNISKWKTFIKIHLPLAWPVFLSSAVLFLVDCFKEMPIQLMTRSFGWDTLSIKIYEFTSEGEWERAANLSLLLLAIGLLPIGILIKENRNES